MASGSTAGMDDDYEALISTTDMELLKRAWRNEKAAPEILRFETALIQRIRGQIQLMEETTEEFSSSGIDPLTVSLYQMDLDRTQYLLRSYLRIRLQKIGKYMFHISNNPEVQNRLSEQEKGFAKRCTEDMERHLEESVLSKLPDNYQAMLKQSIISEENDMAHKKKKKREAIAVFLGKDHYYMHRFSLLYLSGLLSTVYMTRSDPCSTSQVDLDQDFVGLICNCLKARQSGTMYIYLEIYNCSIPLSFPVPEPQLDTFVVCKSRRFLGPFQLDGSDELLEMKPDDLCIIHYKSIRERVQEGEIDLV